MKKALFLLAIVVAIGISCENKVRSEDLALNEKINSLSIIIDDQLWNGAIGDSLRNKFATPVVGLPQEEPLFTINQYPVKLLEGFMAHSRNILLIKKAESNYFEIRKNQYAKPQTVVYIYGKTTTDILSQLETNADKIIETFKAGEIAVIQAKIRSRLMSDDSLKKNFNVSVAVPTGYQIALKAPGFLWLKREITSGNTSVLIYEVPISSLNGDKVERMVHIRDSIGKLHILGSRPGTSMITENSYTPYFSDRSLKGKYAFEIRGTWALDGDYMSGPFLNYCIKDPVNQRYLILEGFCYAPSQQTRDLMFELEAILKSVKF